jgi:hypothetical protein
MVEKMRRLNVILLALKHLLISQVVFANEAETQENKSCSSNTNTIVKA